MSNEDENDPDYRMKAKAVWDLHAERLKFVSQIQADHGKWMIVTVTSVHLAAIYLIAQPSIPAVIRQDPASYWPFIIGICLMLACALCTWLNWTMITNVYADWMKPAMLTDRAAWPAELPNHRRRLLRTSFYVPLFLGFASGCCIPWGGYRVFYYPHPPIMQTIHVTPSAAAKPAAASPQAKPVVDPMDVAEKPKR